MQFRGASSIPSSVCSLYVVCYPCNRYCSGFLSHSKDMWISMVIGHTKLSLVHVGGRMNGTVKRIGYREIYWWNGLTLEVRRDSMVQMTVSVIFSNSLTLHLQCSTKCTMTVTSCDLSWSGNYCCIKLEYWRSSSPFHWRLNSLIYESSEKAGSSNQASLSEANFLCVHQFTRVLPLELHHM